MNTDLWNGLKILDLNKIEDEYLKKHVRKILLSKSLEDLKSCIDKIYSEGYEDGSNENVAE